MSAYIWNANPGKWEVVPPSTTSWDALKAYVTDLSNYVYWSTPVLQADIRTGDIAFIWRTRYLSHQNGIIAVGHVEESPRELNQATVGQFRFRTRLRAAGWNEAKAPSSWKTGIRIDQIFWNNPIQSSIRPAQGTVRRLHDGEAAAIEREMSAGNAAS